MDSKRRDFLIASAAAATATGSLSGKPARAAEVAPGSGAAVASAATPYRAGTEDKRLDIVNLRELESLAQAVIPAGGFDYIRGGAGDEWTLHENLAAFARVAIEPRYLSGVKQPDTSALLLGVPLSLPVITAPMGGHRLAHEAGEAGTAAGTAAAGSLMVVSSVSNLALETVMAASPAPKWFQVYLPTDRGVARELLQRARQAGYRAIVVTVDTGAASNRERDTRNHFHSPPELGQGNQRSNAGSGYAESVAAMKHDLSWADIEFVQHETALPVLVKGVLAPKLAEAAVEHGAAGLFVSNHGGRQLDGTPATFTVLPRIADAVKGRIPIILDGGVRRGQDVFRALAAGAHCVAVGRPVLYGLALGGALGVQSVYDRLRAELVMTMQLAGAANVAAIDRSYLLPPGA